jgi:hypothetical protein
VVEPAGAVALQPQGAAAGDQVAEVVEEVAPPVRRRPSESCFSIYEDVEWLSESPISGTVTADTNSLVTVTFDATNLTPGVYNATLVIANSDVGAAQGRIPVTLTVPDQFSIYLPTIKKNT